MGENSSGYGESVIFEQLEETGSEWAFCDGAGAEYKLRFQLARVRGSAL